MLVHDVDTGFSAHMLVRIITGGGVCRDNRDIPVPDVADCGRISLPQFARGTVTEHTIDDQAKMRPRSGRNIGGKFSASQHEIV